MIGAIHCGGGGPAADPDGAPDMAQVGADGAAPDLGPGACALSQTAPAPGGQIYHVSPGGNDRNPGTSPEAALKTLASALGRARGGDVVWLEAGAVFNEIIDIQPGRGGSAGRPIVISSDPARRATITAPSGKSGITIYDADHVTVENLIVQGPGMNATRAGGVRVLADAGRYQGVALRNLDVSGFYEGLAVLSWERPTDGYSDLLIERVDLHHNLTGGGSVYGTAPSAFVNVVVRCSRFHHNPGDPNLKRPSGDGFVLGGVTNGLIDRCVAHDNGGMGTNNAGPVGLWAYNSTQVTIQFSESYNNKALFQDGDGFDLDLGTTNSVIQYCYSHDNYGAGYLLSQAGTDPWSNNVLRYNISENDASGQKLGAITYYSDFAAPTGLRSSWVYGNTVYTSVGPALNITSAPNSSKNYLFNNIFVTAKGHKLVWDWSGNARAGVLTIVGNLYWASGGAVDLQGARSLEAWRTASGQELLDGKPAGLFADPLLTQSGAGGAIGDPAMLSGLTAYRLMAGSPARGAGLDPRRFGADPGKQDFYGAPLPQGVGFDIGAYQSR